MLKKINKALRIICIPLNIINLLVGILMGIAYVYIPVTSVFGLILGIALSTSGCAMMGISYLFTQKNVKQDLEKADVPTKHTKASTLFLCLALPLIALSSGGTFFYLFTGIIFVAGALSLPFGPGGVLALAIICASSLALGMLINSWLQTHNFWQSLKEVVKVENIQQADEHTPLLLESGAEVAPRNDLRKTTTCRLLEQIKEKFTGKKAVKESSPAKIVVVVESKFCSHRLYQKPETRQRSHSAPPAPAASGLFHPT